MGCNNSRKITLALTEEEKLISLHEVILGLGENPSLRIELMFKAKS
jgi:hypothetical protein